MPEPAGAWLQLPLPEEKVFRYEAMDDVLELVARRPGEEFGVVELQDRTGHGSESVVRAVELLERLSLVSTRRDGRSKLVSANPDAVHAPDDPVQAIPQAEFREPVRAFVEELEAELEGVTRLEGAVVFGSVARGDADRLSDVDVFVLVADEVVAARRHARRVAGDLADRRFDGDRYRFEPMVESPESARNHGERLRDVLDGGVAVVQREGLNRMTRAIRGDGRNAS